MIRTLLLIAISAAYMATTVAKAQDEQPAGAKSLITYSGGEITRNSWATYSGAILALDQNLATPGLSINAFFLNGKYDYNKAYRHCGSKCTTQTGSVDVDWYQGHLMLGYTGIYQNQLWYGAYAGVDYQDHQLSSSDLLNSVSGQEFGAKFAAEVQTVGLQDYFVSAYGEYSTAFDSYFTKLQVGPVFQGVTFGAEGMLLGDEEWRAQRLGSFVKVPFYLGPELPSGKVTLSGGYQFSDADDTQGGYGTLQVKFLF